ncbi:TetR/AcrR family transcriptional regulator [Polyangium sp. 6x1]|uniref:TetR/AcrR family transcriptional regulator n=1 Tax=Polyangium sp. 6x1 TaxID=3042689 RepID=UPI0024827690|nr:TetR/AcrR family transcriptional regulator [Polyangium sp. 6x1]MDI1446129.1 TetR/AcrR family transcriptional regulator [Polyangium sp. 6x1]
MGRPAGSRNPDFEATRASLVAAVQKRLSAPDGPRASFREMAAAAGVSVATLRHYFGSREGVVSAVLSHWHERGQRYMLEVATGPLLPVRASLRTFLAYLEIGFRGGVEEVHAIGLACGLREPTLGPRYLGEVLDPTLESVEARLARHVARGELRAGDVRQMALLLVAPPLVVLLHQNSLGGTTARPLDWETFADEHVDAFLRAYGTGHEAPAEPGAEASFGGGSIPPLRKRPRGGHDA